MFMLVLQCFVWEKKKMCQNKKKKKLFVIQVISPLDIVKMNWKNLQSIFNDRFIKVQL